MSSLERFRDVDLLKDHLQSARQYMFGAMPEEYRVSLEWARCAVDTVPDHSLRGRLDEEIAKLIEPMSPSRELRDKTAT
ncbi:MAG: hypothetical protein ABI833_14455 [Acidobacteriota bacterium]